MCAQVAPSGECLRGKGPPDQMLAKPWRGLFLVAYTGHPGQLSLAIPSWVGALSTSQRAVMPCGWGVKAGYAGMVRV